MKHLVTILAFLLTGFFLYEKPEPLGGPKEDDIYTMLDQLYVKYGDYVQVTSDGRIMVKGNQVTEAQLSSKLPPGTQIHVYGGPEGNGYQLVMDTPTSTVYYGVGPMAADLTYTVPKTTASTTP